MNVSQSGSAALRPWTPYLDYIASTPVSKRGSVVQHIICRDGTRLSVQASKDHSCLPVNNKGPWAGFEVVTPIDTEINWSERDIVLTIHLEQTHKATGFVHEHRAKRYTRVPVHWIKQFIIKHGGEDKEAMEQWALEQLEPEEAAENG